MKRILSLSVVLLMLSSLTWAQAMQDDLLPRQSRRGVLSRAKVLRRAASTQDKGPGGDYFFGQKHQLVVLASFADNPFLADSAATVAQWNKILNTRNFNEEPFAGSFRDYLYDQSYGQFDLVCDFQLVYVDSCVRYQSTEADDENSQYLVQDIVAQLRNRDINWSLYDWNGDGYVNQLLIIYAGQGSAYGGFGPRYDAIWPHQFWLTLHEKDRQSGVYCEPETVTYQNVDFLVDSYCAVQEIAQDSTYANFGTLCHEFTHCFGFPDFYSSSTSRTPGYWDLMDRGNYNGNGYRPAGYSAHERWLMGWLTPIELTTPTEVADMPALADQPVAYIIQNDAYPEEYYMLENRQKKGWDTALPGQGLVIFHVDYDPSVWIYDIPNKSNKQSYRIIPANNIFMYRYSSGWAYPYVVSDSTINNELTDSSAPPASLWYANTSGEKLMSKPVTNISVTDSLVSFSFMSVPTSLENQRSNDKGQMTNKFIRNGLLFIERNGKVYNALGLPVR